MARVTVEDCLDNVENRFLLVLVAAKRVKQLIAGKRALIETDNRENVVALREIAAGKIAYDIAPKPPELPEEEIVETKKATKESTEEKEAVNGK